METIDPKVSKEQKNKKNSSKDKDQVVLELESYIEKCLQCKKPKCKEGCPFNFDIPKFLNLIKEKEYQKALEMYYELTPFPITLSLICPHQCEDFCVLSKKGEGTPISKIKNIIATHFGLPEEFSKLKDLNGKNIMIIGSGPASLKSAYFLRKNGFNVTVYEGYNKLGGMLVLGIPEFRLPRDVVDSEIENLKKIGIKFITNTKVDKEKFKEILNSGKFDAIIIAVGAHEPRTMGIEGEDSPDVLQALTFLKNYNLKRNVKVGKKVAVIGGGNVAFDSARASRRLGAEVIILYRRSEKEMPGSKHELEMVLEDGIKINYLTNPIEVLTDKNNRVKGLKLVKMKLGELDKSGRPRPIPIEGSEHEMEIDTVIEAIGQRTSLEMVLEKFGISDIIDTLKIEKNYVIGKNILIIGDCFTGPRTVIESIKSADDGCKELICDLENGT
ncbi:MAG: FAD-dependent oxidoreductase [Candidatus Helarchaeota archaeon]